MPPNADLEIEFRCRSFIREVISGSTSGGVGKVRRRREMNSTGCISEIGNYCGQLGFTPRRYTRRNDMNGTWWNPRHFLQAAISTLLLRSIHHLLPRNCKLQWGFSFCRLSDWTLQILSFPLPDPSYYKRQVLLVWLFPAMLAISCSLVVMNLIWNLAFK